MKIVGWKLQHLKETVMEILEESTDVQTDQPKLWFKQTKRELKKECLAEQWDNLKKFKIYHMSLECQKEEETITKNMYLKK